MRLRDPRLLLTVFSVALVLTLFYHELGNTSPGPISATHAQEPALADGQDCRLCHGGAGISLSQACTACHAAIATQLEQSSGFHGTLAGDPADCGRCHLEHHGREFDLVGSLAFREAGFERDEYDHAALGFTLAGAHLELECTGCHERADAARLRPGEVRFLGLDQECSSCHEDPHGGQMARACADCHGQAHPFADLSAFRHTGTFPLDGGHARSACDECHEPATPFSIEALAGHAPPTDARGCAACHADPHRPGFLAGVAAAADLPEAERSCELCHAPGDDSFVPSRELDPGLHAVSGVRLEGPHDLACAACHGEPAASVAFARRFPGRGEEDCAACHADPHDGGMGSSCSACHSLPHAFAGLAGFVHTAAFELRGAHAGLACATCHDPAGPGALESYGARSSPAPARACAECHASPHSQEFADGTAALLGASVAEACAECHDPAAGSFARTTRPVSSKMHATTGFELRPPHAALDCGACHAAGADAPFTARYPGRRPEDCAACHADPHGGQFTNRSPAASGCTSCHFRETFVPVDFDLARHAGTAFPLEGSHRAVACRDCHARTDERSPRAFVGTPLRCEGCHEDVHGGAFDAAGAPDDGAAVDEDGALLRGCARCHTPERFDRVADAAFEHGAWTGFGLEGPHATVACDACHSPAPVRGTGGRRFGYAAGRACANCHADPHAGQFAQAGGTDCSRCHTGREPFDEVAFDHGRQTRFPLDERHRELACVACHVPWSLADGGRVVRYKPLGTSCGDCHSTTTPGGSRR